MARLLIDANYFKTKNKHRVTEYLELHRENTIEISVLLRRSVPLCCN